jgi:hypothetical protein
MRRGEEEDDTDDTDQEDEEDDEIWCDASQHATKFV